MPRPSKHDGDQIVAAWRSLPVGMGIMGKVAETARIAGCSVSTARRMLSNRGILGHTGTASVRAEERHKTALRATASESAERILSVIAPAVTSPHQVGVSLAAGLVLADVITNQRREVQVLSTTCAQLSEHVAALLQPQLDESGNPLPMDEGVIHRAAATVSKLVDATVKLHEATRDAWGIRKDQGPKSYAEMLEELDRTPPPVGNPPHVLGRNLTETPSHASISAGNSGLASTSTPDQDPRSDTPEVGNPPEGSEELSRLVPCRGALDGV